MTGPDQLPTVSVRRSVRVLLIAVCSVVGMWLLNATAADRGPIIPKGQGDHCVADTDYMRRNHMDLLTHQRDDTVIRGIRGEPYSLVDCVDCHVQKNAAGDPIRIDEEGQFCQSCHTYAAVKIDCFGCHAAVPDQASLSLHPKKAMSSVDAIQHHLNVALGELPADPVQLTNLTSYRNGLNRLLKD